MTKEEKAVPVPVKKLKRKKFEKFVENVTYTKYLDVPYETEKVVSVPCVCYIYTDFKLAVPSSNFQLFEHSLYVRTIGVVRRYTYLIIAASLTHFALSSIECANKPTVTVSNQQGDSFFQSFRTV